MALKVKNQSNNYVTASKMEIGASVEGYLEGFRESKFSTPEQPIYDIVLRRKDGSTFVLNQAGNLRYIKQDFDETDRYTAKAYTVITRTEDVPMKNRKGTRSNFSIAQDDEDIFQGEESTENSAADRVAEIRANAKTS